MLRLLLLFGITGAAAGVVRGAPPPLQTGRPQVAVLLSQDAPPYREALQGFRERLGEAAPGAEVLVTVLPAGKDVSSLTQTLRDTPPALVLALGSPAAEIARQLNDVPVVAGMVLRPTDVLRGPQFTGVFLEFPPEMEFRYLARILPRLRRVAVLYHQAQNQRSVDEARRAARAAGLELVARSVDEPSAIPATLRSLALEADVLWGLADTLVLTPETARPILLFSLQNRIPFVGLSAPWVRAGAVYALERDYGDIGRQCADLAEELLSGRSPAALPPVPPRRVTYLVNRRVADQLRLTLSRDVLRGAAEIIE